MEDLREFYITPLYLETMASRARSWSVDFIQDQMERFRSVHPDYPELSELLESELHRRSLNEFRNIIKTRDRRELETLLKKEKKETDFYEMLTVELAIRKGEKRLHDPEES